MSHTPISSAVTQKVLEPWSGAATFLPNLRNGPPGCTTKSAPGAVLPFAAFVCQRVKELDPTMFTKSGIMVGLGEKPSVRDAGLERHARGQYMIL